MLTYVITNNDSLYANDNKVKKTCYSTGSMSKLFCCTHNHISLHVNDDEQKIITCCTNVNAVKQHYIESNKRMTRLKQNKNRLNKKN